MKRRMIRRAFLRQTAGTFGLAVTGIERVLPAFDSDPRRIFVALFAHETNTFHPVATTGFSYSTAAELRLPAWKDPAWTIVSGVAARPAGGGTISEAACREAIGKVLDSLRAARPVDAVFLRLHGAMYAEGVGPAGSNARGSRATRRQSSPPRSSSAARGPTRPTPACRSW